MPRKKYQRYTDNQNYDMILQPGSPLFDTIRGKWSELFFKNANPIVLELACGKGEYSTSLAKIYPDKNFIGIDIKGDRMRFGIQDSLENKLNNVGFLRTKIQNLGEFFSANEVAEIRIVHPDPRPKGSDERRRLTHGRFLETYKQILIPGGILRLKTDDAELFAYSLSSLKKHGRELIDTTVDLHNSELLSEHHGIITRYEKLFLEQGRKIHYAKRRNNLIACD